MKRAGLARSPTDQAPGDGRARRPGRQLVDIPATRQVGGGRFGWLLRIVLLCGWASVAASSLAAPFPLTWRWSNPKPHGNDIFDLLSTDGIFIQVCDRGQIYSSADLVNWLPLPSPTTNALRAITLFQGELLIAGGRGTLLRGNLVDGFSLRNLGTEDWLEGIAASPTLAVAVGDRAAIYTSSDGQTWQRRTPPFTNWLRSVAFGNGTFVTVGVAGLIATSPDGITWTRRAPPSQLNSDFNRVAWLGDRFWIAGDALARAGLVRGVALSSADGQSWRVELPDALTFAGPTNNLYAIAGTPSGARLVAGDGAVRLKEAGASWTDETAPAKAAPAPVVPYLNALAQNEVFILSGKAGVIVRGTQSTPDTGFDWVRMHDSFRFWFWDVTRTPDFYLAVGDPAAVMSSDDGITWTLEFVPEVVAGEVLLGVGGRSDLFVVAGSAGSLLYSSDGALWSAVQPRPTGKDLQGVAALGDLLVVTGGDGTILTSTNGTSWTQRPKKTSAFLSGVTAFPGGLVAVGDQGTVLTSPDGVDWTPRASGTTNWIYRVRYAGGRLIAVGQNGLILTSSDGLDWQPQLSGTPRWLNDVAFLDDTWFIVGNQGTLLTSTNATDWTPADIITSKSLFGLATFEGQLLAVGLDGAILRSQVIPRTTPVHIEQYAHSRTNDLVTDVFLFTGVTDQQFTLENALELTNWTAGVALELLDPSGTLLYVQTSSSSNAPPSRFFRTRLKQP